MSQQGRARSLLHIVTSYLTPSKMEVSETWNTASRTSSSFGMQTTTHLGEWSRTMLMQSIIDHANSYVFKAYPYWEDDFGKSKWKHRMAILDFCWSRHKLPLFSVVQTFNVVWRQSSMVFAMINYEGISAGLLSMIVDMIEVCWINICWTCRHQCLTDWVVFGCFLHG